MDVLSSLLKPLDLEAFTGGFASCVAPFGMHDRAPPGHAAVHLVCAGSGVARADHGPVQRLAAGDAILLRGGTGLRLNDAPDRPCEPVSALVDRAPDPFRLEVGAGRSEEVDCLVFCGSVTIASSGIAPMLDSLPESLVCRSGPTRPVQAALIACLRAMHERPCRLESLQITHLLQAWFIETLGLALAGANDLRGCWRAMQDHRLARAIKALHERPGEAWTVSGLAALAGLSRPRFAARFVAIVGETPLRYLNRWRVECAARRLLAGDTVTAVARAMGFANAATFAKVFRRYRDCAPRQWLRRQRESLGGSGG